MRDRYRSDRETSRGLLLPPHPAGSVRLLPGHLRGHSPSLSAKKLLRFSAKPFHSDPRLVEDPNGMVAKTHCLAAKDGNATNSQS